MVMPIALCSAGTTTDAVGHSQPIHKKAKEDFCQFGSGIISAAFSTIFYYNFLTNSRDSPHLWISCGLSRQFVNVVSVRWTAT
jgi:hypothetical protein